MEILNNIWVALTTENETLTTLVTLPLLFVETYLFLYVSLCLFKIPATTKQKIIYVISVSAVFLFSNFFITAPFNLIVNYVFMFIMIHTLFKLNILKSILAILLPLFITAICGNLIMNPFLKLFGVTYTQLSVTPLYKLIYQLTLYCLIAIFVYIARHYKFSLHLLDDLDKKSRNLIYINLGVGFFTLFVQAIIAVYFTDALPVFITLLIFISTIAYFFISIYSLTRVIKLQLTTKELETAESYNNSLTVLYDNVRGFKHDFDNIVNSIGGYIKTDNMEGLKKYYTELEKDCVRVNNVELLNPKIINNPGIYNLVVAKYQKATDLGVKINLEIFFDFNELHMPIYEFSRILGILLDNAIEAAKECEEKEINLMFRESRKNSVQIISVENTYMNKDVDTKKIFEKGVSGKENHSGIGLWEVNQIINRNNNIVLHPSKDDKFFKQQLEIYY